MNTDTRQNRSPSPARADPAPAAAGKIQRPARIAAPKPRRDVGLAWLVLLGLLALASMPLLIELGRPAAWSADEALAVAMSAETHRRKNPVANARTSLQAWTPVYQGVNQWHQPPGGVWLHQVMFIGLDRNDATDDSADQQALLIRARLGSVAMALLLIASVYWAGHSIGGVGTATLSAGVAMTMPLLIGVGKFATPDSAAMAWSTLSVAGALWAMRPLRASPALTRQLVGWIICGTALGLAVLTAGPRAAPATLLCTVVLAMLCPRRVGHVMGLLASTAIATLVLVPWALHAHNHDPKVWQLWVDQLRPDLADQGLITAARRAGWRLSLAAALAGLWLVWLIPALAQPLSTSSTGPARRRMLLGWGWLVTATALAAFAPGPTRLTGLLLTVAPASLAVGLVIQQFHDLSAEGRHARLWRVCRWFAAAIAMLLGVALPLLGYLISHRPDLTTALPDLRQALLEPMPLSFYLGSALALVLTAVLSLRFALGHHPGRATAALALWLIVAYSLAAIPIARGPLLTTPAEPAPGAAPAATVIAP